jgi:NAD-dependent dihydropyrimidine dehydrogenase PreA subunit
MSGKKRKVIEIDEELCDGCGLCIPNCPEGALQIIEGKARLVSETSCDGLGACLGHCPTGALTVTERDAEPYDEIKVMEQIVKKGRGTIAAHLHHLKDHGEEKYLRQARDFLQSKGIEDPLKKEDKSGKAAHNGGGCPGSRSIDFSGNVPAKTEASSGPRPSALRNWPVQLHLINPDAPYLEGADLLVAADCVPFAMASFHEELLNGKVLIILCPKLDGDMESYIEKLTHIFKTKNVKSVTVAHMEVPCCFGALQLVKEAQARAGTSVPVRKVVISISGQVKK